MSDVRPPVPEAAAPSVSRSNRWIRILCLGLLLAAVMSLGPSASFAGDDADDRAISPEAAASLQARIASLEESLFSDLMARVEAKSERVVQQATDRHLAAMLHGHDPLGNAPTLSSPAAPL
jgi:hypothetical protein